MKICTVCKQNKSLDDFHNRSDSKDGKQGLCKVCNISRVRIWQDENPDRYELNWRRASGLPGRDIKRRAEKYGLSVDDLIKLIDDAKGVCEICHRLPIRWLVVDHSHSTSVVRGILCEKCNQALGLFDDNVEFMKSAIEYLTK